MKMDIHNHIKTILVIILLALNNNLFSQYLRDSTKYIGLNDFYPGDDSQILEKYDENEKHHLSFDNVFSIPEVLVYFEEKKYPLQFDFGNNGNITITTNICDSIEYKITDTTFTYTPDGQIRGQVFSVIIPEFRSLGQSFVNETGTLSDWTIYSTNPFNGLIGLKYLDNKCFTLSYPQKILAISNHSIVPELKNGKRDLIHLEYYKMHPYGVHFKGKVNDREAIIYFDTGKSHSAINQNLVPSDRIVSDKSGAFYNDTVDIEIGGRSFSVYYPRVKNTNRNIDSNLPVGIEIGSDILKYFLLTIDRTNNQNLLIIH
jgi:antitoxin component YwqK of YwqJK toxin-antitoxin module